MKRLSLIFTAVIFTTLNTVTASELNNVKFYGIDFSGVNVTYAKESRDEFMEMFKSLNTLMIVEATKFDFERYLSVDIETKEIKYAIGNIDLLSDRDFTDYDLESINLDSIIATYPSTEGTILLIVAKEFNKAEAKGVYDIVMFDGQTKRIISQSEMVGDAGGFGLRNFWANTIYTALKRHYKANKSK